MKLLAVAALIVMAGSIAYFLLGYVPARDRASAEVSRLERESRMERDCAEQAKRAVAEFATLHRRIGTFPDGMFPGSNHFNRHLNKCLVAVSASDERSNTEYLLDAYEGAVVLSCMSVGVSTDAPRRQICSGENSPSISAAEFEKRSKALMSE